MSRIVVSKKTGWGKAAVPGLSQATCQSAQQDKDEGFCEEI
jgi:hypothetical protein